MTEKKVYGLIMPKKKEPIKAAPMTSVSSNIFGDDSDEEEKSTTTIVGPFGLTQSNNKMKRQTQMDIDKAIQENPDIYEYDNIYDDMQASKPKVGIKEKEKATKDRKPKYIAGLLKAAEVKKKEDDRRKERQVQKEREAEGAKYADKESFVTSAYKKKMLEMQAEEEEEKRKAQIDEMTDVTKQKDMSGFYRYLYKSTTGDVQDVKDVKPDVSNKIKDESLDSEYSDTKPVVKEEPKSPIKEDKSEDESESGSSSDSEQASVKPDATFNKTVKGSNFRKRQDSASEGSDTRDARRDESDDKMRKHHKGSNSGSLRDSQHHSSRNDSRQKSPAQRDKRRRSRSRSPARRKKRSHSKSPSIRKKRSHSKSPSRRHKRSHSKSPSRRNKMSNSESPSRKNRRSHSRSPRSKQQRNHSESISHSQNEDTLPSNGSAAGSNGNGEHSLDKFDNMQKNLKESGSVSAKSVYSKKEEKIDPAKKVYPHHNSKKDIEEARKRYFMRKIERAQSRIA